MSQITADRADQLMPEPAGNVPAKRPGKRIARRARRAGRSVFGRALMGIWVVLPLFPVLGALATWWLGIR